MFESKTVQCLGHGKADGRTISKAKANNATSRAAKTQIDSTLMRANCVRTRTQFKT